MNDHSQIWTKAVALAKALALAKIIKKRSTLKSNV